MKVLVVIDAQNDFIDGALRNEEAIKAVPHIVEKIKNWNGPIITTQDTHNPDYLDTREGKFLPIKHCIKGTKGHLINEDIWNAIADRGGPYCFINKKTFGYTLLPEFIDGACNAEKIDEIEFCGFCTDICVISNALIVKAAFPEVDIKVDATCCAGVTPEKHEAALSVMESCQIEVIR